MLRALLALALGLVLLTEGNVAAAGNLQDDLLAVLEEYQQENPQAPGVVVWMYSPALDLDWCAALGSPSRGSDEPLTCIHTFRIASNTKPYVAAAILRLAERGRLDLDDPLLKHLRPERRELLAGDGYDLSAMTLRQVLSHTSGLNEHPADPRYEEAILADPQHRWTPDEQVARCVEWTDPVAAPGDSFSYSDTGYVLLGEILTRQTGLGLGAAVRSLLDFEGLGLGATWWEVLEDRTAGAGPRAHQYYADHDTYDWDPSLDLYGGGGLVCDVRDLGGFMRLLLQGKVLQQKETLEQMIGGGTADYRLGLIHTSLGEHEAWGHSGFWNTFAYQVPDLDLTVAGCVLNHFAAKGQTLADRLVAVAAACVAED